MEDGITLRDYAVALLSKWWIVLFIFGVTTAAAVVISSQLPPKYQVRTQLLLLSRTSERLTTPGASAARSADTLPNVATALSVDTLSNLALANDLLEEVIGSLGLANPERGDLMAVESLAGMMQVEIQVSEQGTRTVLPLLTMTVQGEEPLLLKQIADAWADQFIQQNVLLFASESVRSFDFIQAQYDETRNALLSKNQEKLTYLEENLVQPLRSELLALTGVEAETRGVESVESQVEPNLGSTVVVTGGGGTGRTGLFERFLAGMEEKRVDLAAAQAEHDQLMEALKEEPATLEHTRSTLSGGHVVEQVTEEETNLVYVFLKEKIADAGARVAALTSEVAQLETKTAEFKATIKDLSEKITQVEVVESAFDTEIAALTKNLEVLATNLQEARLANEEQAGSIRVVESAIVPRVPVGPNRQQFILPAVAVGLLVGVVVALLVHYVQRGGLRVERSGTSQS